MDLDELRRKKQQKDKSANGRISGSSYSSESSLDSDIHAGHNEVSSSPMRKEDRVENSTDVIQETYKSENSKTFYTVEDIINAFVNKRKTGKSEHGDWEETRIIVSWSKLLRFINESLGMPVTREKICDVIPEFGTNGYVEEYQVEYPLRRLLTGYVLEQDIMECSIDYVDEHRIDDSNLDWDKLLGLLRTRYGIQLKKWQLFSQATEKSVSLSALIQRIQDKGINAVLIRSIDDSQSKDGEDTNNGNNGLKEDIIRGIGTSLRRRSSSRVDNVYSTTLRNIENTLSLYPYSTLGSGFPNRLQGIQRMIDKGDLSSYEVDRLKILQAGLSLLYFNNHYLDEDFSEHEEEYLNILDSIDDYVQSMSEITDEGAYIYWIANMYSADRFENIDPVEKLQELWGLLSGVELDSASTEFEVSLWIHMAQEVYDMMLAILDPTNRSEDTREVIMSIIADKLNLDREDVHSYSRLVEDLGIDSLDGVDLIMEFEKVFNIIIPDDDAVGKRTVGDIIGYIRGRIE